MGILGSLFGSNKNKQPSNNDGLWIQGEKNCSWQAVAKLSNNQIIELGPESCFTNSLGTFCVLRSVLKNENTVIYMGCVIIDEDDDFILIAVDRHESLSGSVIKKDDWSKNRALSVSKVPNIKNIINAAKGHAAVINYQTLPPYVFWISINLSGK
jgi:hypothetical protein